MYIRNMANKKRRERMQSLYRIKLGRYRLNRRDILVIEKILREYADVFEKREAKRFGQSTTPPTGRRHMPRKFADLHVNFNGERADSVKFLSKDIKRSSNFEVRCSPGMWVEFRPFSTTIGGQVLYATGMELKTIKQTAAKIETYLKRCKKSFMNICLVH